MLVTRVIGDCPSCKSRNCFGNVSVGKNSILRGCGQCDFTKNIYLPSIKKKILYLDQFFFSNAFKKKEKRFIKTANKIKDLTDKQVLVVPYSNIHEDETYLWRGYMDDDKEGLLEFIKISSRGHKFKADTEIEISQIIKSFKKFLRNDYSVFNLELSEIFDSEIHGWENYFWIDVTLGNLRDSEEMRRIKENTVEWLVDEIFPVWREKSYSFEEYVKEENQSAVKAYVEVYLEYAERMARGDFMAQLDSPVLSQVIELMISCLPRDSSIEVVTEKLGNFFRSAYFTDLPFQWLSSRMFAKLREQVRAGAYKNSTKAKKRLSGFFYDVKHISTYAPYCDAIVVDNSMFEMVDNKPISIGDKYNTQVFSLNNWNEFEIWLERLYLEISLEHAEALKEL